MSQTITMTVEELECVQEQSYEAGRRDGANDGFSLAEVEALKEEWVGRLAEDRGRQTVLERRLSVALEQLRSLEETLVGILGPEAALKAKGTPARGLRTSSTMPAVTAPPMSVPAVGGTPVPMGRLPTAPTTLGRRQN